MMVVLGACSSHGSSSNDGGDGFITSVDHRKTIGQLGPDERTRLCADASAYLSGTLVPDLCRHAALVVTAQTAQMSADLADADLQTSCVAYAENCKTSVDGGGAFIPGQQDGSAGGGITCDLSTVQTSCAASVADFVACLSETDAAYRESPSCSAVTRELLAAFLSDGGVAAARPPSCAVVDQCLASRDGGSN